MHRAAWPARILALLLVFAFSANAAEQLIFHHGGQEESLVEGVSSISTGELRQYAFGVEVLEELQRQQADIWKITPTTIDVYVPQNSASGKSVSLQYNYTVLARPDLPNLSHHEEDLDEEVTELAEQDFRRTKKHPLFNLTLLSHDFHEQYHHAVNISRFLKSLSHTFPNHTKLVHIGHSYEGRKITGIKIKSPEPLPKGVKARKAIVIIGAQHAREWIATSTSLYIAHSLLVNPVDQPVADAKHSLRRLLDRFEFHIIPLPNPDGYEYTRKRDRLWYKNRQPVTAMRGKVCKGMDMNRNWGYEWLPAADPSSDPCGHWFPGSRPFEAHEVNALASYLTYRTGPHGHVAAFLDLRSYGQMLSAPFSYSCDVYPADAEDQIEAALGAAQAGSRVHGITINTGRLCETLYSAPGNIVDWAYGHLGIKYAYAAHLRDTGTYGFLIPEEWIRPTGEETAALVGYLATFIARDPKTMR